MMDPKRIQLTGKAVPIRGNEIDTDQIIPARFLKEITFQKMGDYLFYDSRFDEQGQSRDFPLNNPVHQGATLMIVGKNFGCGSSREHAPQAIMRYGIQAVIGESFAEIFAGNCQAIGVPVVTASRSDIEALWVWIEAHPETVVTLNLAKKTVTYVQHKVPIDLPASRRIAMMQGSWDALAMLSSNTEKVRETASRLPYMQGFLCT